MLYADSESTIVSVLGIAALGAFKLLKLLSLYSGSRPISQFLMSYTLWVSTVKGFKWTVIASFYCHSPCVNHLK